MKFIFGMMTALALTGVLWLGCDGDKRMGKTESSGNMAVTNTGEVENSEKASDADEGNRPNPDEKARDAAAPDESVPVEEEPVIETVSATADTGEGTTVASGEDVTVVLNSVILARGVDKRQPVEPGTRFVAGDGQKVYAILDVSNSLPESITLMVSWKLPDSDREIGKTDVTVKPGKNWRTWAFTRSAQKVGTWEAIVRDAAEIELARVPFEIVE